ncbi:MAG: DUF2974 domain-containing protein [Erysipelotrichaceae bacterium]|nr:DUF2974 domain-containing protein [Erysipelotrichaceae bacterium]
MKNMNIEDYILWRGDYTFAEEPFNQIDALVFSELAYVNYAPAGLLGCGAKSMPLKEAGKIIMEQDAYELKTLYGGQENFFRLAYESDRFGNVLIRNYTEITDPEDDMQFSAVHFQYGAHQTFIGFRGTDASIVGWKEDFMIAFTLTASQQYALEYLENTVHEGMNYIVGGHSKGGNLAMYAIANLAEEKQKLIDHIYVLDAPGFAPDVFDRSKLSCLYDKTTRIMPEFCIISKIYEVEFPDTVIVDSTGVTTQQHDLITWELYGPRLKTVEKNSGVSNAVMEVIMRWALNETIEERKLFVNELFDALSAGGATDITKVSGKGFLKVLEAFAKSSPQARDIAMDLGRALISPNETERREENA